MRILIVSDTHRQNRNLEEVLKRVGPVDMLLHLGDVEGSERYIESIAGCTVQFVAGNNDFFSNLEKEKELRIGKYKVLMTHGHYYHVSFDTEMLKQEARARGMDIVMFGHTHKPLVDVGFGVTALNPGSLSYPRQEGRRPSYIIMELDKQGEAHYSICYL